ncbi:MAG: beta-ketoacyl-[acyl-carrier-protein] synthase family protein [Lentimicrobiaceae bacterium]|jgi:3-oxoacyl-(acyl-carrier-protein) synthase|nr:beta-ketoacyl-[acyl-carrier-protein] synthase family protein [Lentimicrobiaceae bacterium]MBT3455367.1 beta-ketoacyl-[acyl-carrier-protein] synthase family protein [Lentimicrobiaceae bacterium]MBT3818793.1 beta-ketoacyl-[acyl-carrier-protein] synthase family protein [Lentimicrobiaceae bacterium]MBT4190808.1 beta-ketoacyl-[acyl-carrier-protein] synthase family protein [Lentimicrobiaceae bacterium]MBT4467522.1 beta-ketoacyl-[acyl-carrier-protein] synthase family protein [Lentimicrobiaceae bact
MNKVAVTGIGIISPIGKNLGETYDSLISESNGISNIEILDTRHKNNFVVGEIKLTHDELIDIAKVDKSKPWTRTALLGIIAAKQAIKDANIDTKIETALISATTVGGMDRSEIHYKDMVEGNHKDYIDLHHAGNSTEMIADNCNISGLTTTISTACSSSLNSILMGSRLIKNGLVKQAVVGGTDSLSKFTLNGFNTLMILDKEHCRPFDDSRTGLNLGEGSAFLVLEDFNSALSAEKKIYAVVSGYANANDAHHQTASSNEGTGPFLSMKHALNEANLSPDDIDYINVHGTGTYNNDLTEGIAIKRLFGNKLPRFSSTKGYTGHTLGAAGVIESVISILALKHNFIPPNINFSNPIKEIDIEPERKLIDNIVLSNVLTNSFGFGGNDSSIVFSSTKNYSLADNKTSKLKKAVYINGMGCVSPQDTIGGKLINYTPPNSGSNFLQILKPNYREYINPKLLRRMSKIVRMGIISSGIALKEADITKPDAIITGTGMGCMEDTEKFLNAMIVNDEELLTPTAFIQSTHNTIGGAIALSLNNHSYNLTYVHRTFSFESALLDSMIMINENKAENVLVGGFDEITLESWSIKTKIGHYKRIPIDVDNILNRDEPGAIAGEGSAFFSLSAKKTDTTYASIIDTDFMLNPNSHNNIGAFIRGFLKRNNFAATDIDLVLLGRNGDSKYDGIYDSIDDELFTESDSINYKYLCGEFDTSSAIATWLGAQIIKNNKIPDIFPNPIDASKNFNTILIYNQFRNSNHSLILLGSCK